MARWKVSEIGSRIYVSIVHIQFATRNVEQNRRNIIFIIVYVQSAFLCVSGIFFILNRFHDGWRFILLALGQVLIYLGFPEGKGLGNWDATLVCNPRPALLYTYFSQSVVWIFMKRKKNLRNVYQITDNLKIVFYINCQFHRPIAHHFWNTYYMKRQIYIYHFI